MRAGMDSILPSARVRCFGTLGEVDSVSEARFEELVAEGLRLIPPELVLAMSNVAVLIEAEPPAEEPTLLGLYEGTPLTERDEWWAAGSLPDRITIFQGPLERMCADEDDLREEVAVTVVHEIAHHFGIDDDKLHELGWG